MTSRAGGGTKSLLVAVCLALGCAKTVEQAPTPQPATSPVISTYQPVLVSFKSGGLTLRGFLYKPDGDGPFPAIVFNHGSEALPGWKPDQASFYVAHGFVLFVPHRRGHGRSTSAGPAEPVGDGPEVIDALVVQNDDVLGAIAYVAALPYVNPKRIATVGCSYGGIESLLAAERATGIHAAIDFAGGAMRWEHDPALRERMKLAARNARVPVMFVQAENDFSTAPSTVLSEEMRAAKKTTAVKLYPANGTSPMEGHHFCAGGKHPLWGDDVLAFLNQNQVNAAPSS
jgi:carboxymethylenebutenolidase